jgi:hypothetical protein
MGIFAGRYDRMSRRETSAKPSLASSGCHPCVGAPVRIRDSGEPLSREVLQLPTSRCHRSLKV